MEGEEVEVLERGRFGRCESVGVVFRVVRGFYLCWYGVAVGVVRCVWFRCYSLMRRGVRWYSFFGSVFGLGCSWSSRRRG